LAQDNSNIQWGQVSILGGERLYFPVDLTSSGIKGHQLAITFNLAKFNFIEDYICQSSLFRLLQTGDS
jgi:hypothetical protein